MPLDPSIILGAGQGVTPLQNPMDVASKAMAYQNLAMTNQQQRQSFQDEQALRSAYAQNTSVDSNGNASLDRQGLLKNLAQVSPSLVPKVASQFQEMDNQVLKSNLEKVSSAAQMLNGVTDQDSYNAVRSSPLAQTAGAGNWPAQYDPKFVDNMYAQSMSHKDLLEAQAKQQGLDIQKQGQQIEQAKLEMEVTKNKATQNQETLAALQALRGNPALQRAETNVLASKTLNDLAEQVRDPQTGQINLNKLTPQQVSMADHEAIRLATGGTGNESDMQNIKPNTPQYKFAELHQHLTGAVSGADAGPYVQQLLDYGNTLAKSSNTFLYQNAKHVVDAKRNYLSPQDQQRYDSWLNDMKNGKAFFGDQVSGSPAAPVGGNSSWSGAHKDAPIGTVSLGQVKTQNGWVPVNASK